VPVHQILEQTVQDFASEATQVVIYAQDGYVTAFSMDEITESDNIFLAYSKNGQGLGTLDDGGTGPFRIIIQEDEFGTRSVKYVNQIQLR
jgi:DMSO/TMAO reductase YedYZ molybdopterin-dependent catalytic subunit